MPNSQEAAPAGADIQHLATGAGTGGLSRGQKLIWKIDYYDKSPKYGSPDASDLRLTERVMTIMFSHEY